MLAFPSFCLQVDDSVDCVIAGQLTPLASKIPCNFLEDLSVISSASAVCENTRSKRRTSLHKSSGILSTFDNKLIQEVLEDTSKLDVDQIQDLIEDLEEWSSSTKKNIQPSIKLRDMHILLQLIMYNQEFHNSSLAIDFQFMWIISFDIFIPKTL